MKSCISIIFEIQSKCKFPFTNFSNILSTTLSSLLASAHLTYNIHIHRIQERSRNISNAGISPFRAK